MSDEPSGRCADFADSSAFLAVASVGDANQEFALRISARITTGAGAC